MHRLILIFAVRTWQLLGLYPAGIFHPHPMGHCKHLHIVMVCESNSIFSSVWQRLSGCHTITERRDFATACHQLRNIQYGSGKKKKKKNFFFQFADQFYNPRFSIEWFGVNHSTWKSLTWSYALDIPRTFHRPQCTYDIRSVCKYLRVAIDYSVQVSLTFLSHDDNQTKIVTTVNTIYTL